jgi:hypothetical protein
VAVLSVKIFPNFIHTISFFFLANPAAISPTGSTVGEKAETRTTLLRGGGDFLGVDGFLCGVELAGEEDVGGGEVLDGFGVFDDPDGLIGVGDKDGALGFPFGVTDGSTATPTFLDAIGAAGFGVL